MAMPVASGLGQSGGARAFRNFRSNSCIWLCVGQRSIPVVGGGATQKEAPAPTGLEAGMACYGASP